MHNRGTYPDSTRIIESYDLVGDTPTRLALGDKTNDPNLEGYDGINGSYQSNAGNFGVLYKIKAHRVAPNTLITLNPRGGKYMGAMMVNGNIIQTPNTSGGAVSAPNEAPFSIVRGLRADRGNPVYGGAGKQSANQHPAPAASTIKELIHSSCIAMGQPS